MKINLVIVIALGLASLVAVDGAVGDTSTTEPSTTPGTLSGAGGVGARKAAPQGGKPSTPKPGDTTTTPAPTTTAPATVSLSPEKNIQREDEAAAAGPDAPETDAAGAAAPGTAAPSTDAPNVNVTAPSMNSTTAKPSSATADYLTKPTIILTIGVLIGNMLLR